MTNVHRNTSVETLRGKFKLTEFQILKKCLYRVIMENETDESFEGKLFKYLGAKTLLIIA